MRKWLSTILLILSFSASSQTQPELMFSSTPEEDLLIGTQMEIAREAIRSKDYNTAIIIFNNVLLSPPNRFTQEAQARIGSAYEATFKPTKAMAEYRAYIAIYPNSDIIPFVRRKLLALEISYPTKETGPPQTEGPRIASESKIEASASSYYIASSNTSTLLTNLHTTGLFKENEYTTKVIIRENIHTDAKPEVNSIYTLTTASVDVVNTYRDWEVKVGRLSPDYGVLSKFDGAVATYGYGKDTEYTLVLGKPVIRYSNANRDMYGVHMHYSFTPEISTTIYYNRQSADGLEERSALGTEFRYFKNSLSIMAAIEYDTIYKQLNAATFNSHYDGEENRAFVLYDRRKSPVLYADKTLMLGLFGPSNLPYSSVGEALLRSGLSKAELYDYIVSETSTATSFAIGGSKQFGEWTVGGDVQTTTMTGTVSDSQSTSNYSISGNVFNPRIVLAHSFNGIVSYSDIENGTVSFTLLDSTMISEIRLDTTVRVTNKKNKLISWALHHKIGNTASTELQLMLTKIREEIDKTLIVGFRYEF